MDPVNKKLLEKSLGNVSLITEQLAVDPREQVSSGKGLSVFNIAGSKHKIKDLSLVIDDDMKLKSEEPPNAALALCCKSLSRVESMNDMPVQRPRR